MAKPIITTVKSALTWAQLLLQPITEDYLLEGRLILCEVMGVKVEFLIRYPDKALTVSEIAHFQELVTQRATGHPLPYLLGKQAFYDLEVAVTPAVLIPRPETELLVEQALEWAKSRPSLTIADVGTGSGVIALTLAKHLPQAQVIGLDISPEALLVAKGNARTLDLAERITWYEGDLLKPVLDRSQKVDLIVANLPYIATAELASLSVAEYEPHVALDGGADGLQAIRALLEQAPHALAAQGAMFLEIGAGQGQPVQSLAQQAFAGRTVTLHADLAGHDRLIAIV
jgi:release factor glutamine methyltransferase